MFEDITFPVYRKYKNNKHFFKVISKDSFEEIQIIGTKKTKKMIHAKQLPELNQIYDLVYNAEVGTPITDIEYYSI
jgi:hypothetical protein